MCLLLRELILFAYMGLVGLVVMIVVVYYDWCSVLVCDCCLVLFSLFVFDYLGLRYCLTNCVYGCYCICLLLTCCYCVCLMLVADVFCFVYWCCWYFAVA